MKKNTFGKEILYASTGNKLNITKREIGFLLIDTKLSGLIFTRQSNSFTFNVSKNISNEKLIITFFFNETNAIIIEKNHQRN